MDPGQLSKLLKPLNITAGLFLIGWCLYSYVRYGVTACLYLALAIICVGPLDDYLMQRIDSLSSLSPEQKRVYRTLIDQGTSLAMLLLLCMAVYDFLPAL